MIIPIPIHDPEQEISEEEKDYKWICWYINVPSWRCVECNTRMMGRMEYCVYCKMRLNLHVPRRSK